MLIILKYMLLYGKECVKRVEESKCPGRDTHWLWCKWEDAELDRYCKG